MPDNTTQDDGQALGPSLITNEKLENEPEPITPLTVSLSATLPVAQNENDAEELPSTTRLKPTENTQTQHKSSTAGEASAKRKQKLANKLYYYVGGNNGSHVVDDFLRSLGWERIVDRSREDYKLKWCELKSHNNYSAFREGEQLCYQIPNNKVLTTKIGLLTSLQEYDRVMSKVITGKPRIMNYQDFFPETYRMDIKEDRNTLCDLYRDGEIWISKPTGLNQGKGIYLMRNREDIAKFQEGPSDGEERVQAGRKLPYKVPMARIAQRYVTNPLLLGGKKFDVRNYMLVASSRPFVVFYLDGYCRLTCLPYDERSTDMTGHLTNQFMQKKNPLYQEVKEETVWSMDRFNKYVNQHHMQKNDLPKDWVHTVLRRRCQQIMLHCFRSVHRKLESRLGYFDLYGCDFLVDDNFKVLLLEFNCNPALHTNCELLKEIIPNVVTESLKLALEIFRKVKAKERIMPLASQQRAVLLYNGDFVEAEEKRGKSRSIAQERLQVRNIERRKKFCSSFNFRYSTLGQSDYADEIERNQSSEITAPGTVTTANAHEAAVSETKDSTRQLTHHAGVTSSSTAVNVPVARFRSQTSMPLACPTRTPGFTGVAGSRSMPNMGEHKQFHSTRENGL